jgi:hypothetical protein
VPAPEVGARVGETDPNPAHCGLPDRITVFKHAGRPTTEEIVYRAPDGGAELFRSAGEAGFPAQNLLRWLVVALVVGIIFFAAVPAILAHLRQPPEEVDTDGPGSG